MLSNYSFPYHSENSKDSIFSHHVISQREAEILVYDMNISENQSFLQLETSLWQGNDPAPPLV